MKKAVSANSLFHFTKEIRTLFSIIENGLFPRFCLEDISSFSSQVLDIHEIAQPIVCFCDIPFSSIYDHVEKYGKYGIGFSKEWGLKNGISPVMYINSESISSKLIKEAFDKSAVLMLNNSLYDNIVGPIHALQNYFKLSEGSVFVNGELSTDTFNFYEEREWRYVPIEKIVSLTNNGTRIKPILTKKEFLNNSFKKQQDLLIEEHCRLTFQPSDIKYFFVSKEEDVVELINFIEQYYANEHPSCDTRLLLNKIICLESLFQDI